MVDYPARWRVRPIAVRLRTLAPIPIADHNAIAAQPLLRFSNFSWLTEVASVTVDYALRTFSFSYTLNGYIANFEWLQDYVL